MATAVLVLYSTSMKHGSMRMLGSRRLCCSLCLWRCTALPVRLTLVARCHGHDGHDGHNADDYDGDDDVLTLAE